jgi:beta-glucosidase
MGVVMNLSSKNTRSRSAVILSIFLAVIVLLFSSCTSGNQRDEIDKKVEALLSRMTVEEKVGQMTQVDLNVIVKGGYENYDGTIDPLRLETAVNKFKVGSIFNIVNRAYDIDTFHKIITAIQDAAAKNPNPIPVLYGIDAIHGTSYTRNSTLFPHNIGLAATRNPELVYRTAVITAKETRASGIRWNFDPVLDIGRNPLWARFEETYGEDPVIASELGAAVVRGYQGNSLADNTSVAATLKHYMGYSNPRTGRDRTPAYIPEIELREQELPQYRSAVAAGAAAVMINSGDVNGIPAHANRYFLTDILRGELGFKGVIVSDWEDVNRLHNRHKIAPTLKDAVRLAVLAGIDMSMTPHNFLFAELLKELYEEDREVAARVDDSVRRILRLKFEVGLFDNPYPETDAIANFGKPEYAETALKAALQSITLLKNNHNRLPIHKSATVLLAGPAANNISSLHGSWSYTWQGIDPDVYPETTLSVKEAFEEKIGANRVISFSVPDFNDDANYDIRRLKGYAARADNIILCLGEEAYAESPGSIQDLTIDKRQIDLVKAALETGKPVIIILLQGRPRLINAFADDVDAILLAYRPGSRGARAIADIVFGDYNPAGRLPLTYPRYSGDLVLYDHAWTELNVESALGVNSDRGYNPQFPFGHGLSYTTFTYDNFTLDKDLLTGNDTLSVSVTVRNSGNRRGDEIVELYSGRTYAKVIPPMRRLKRFTRITLEPGEEKEIIFKMTADDFAYTRYGEEHGTFERAADEGEISLMIAGFGFELTEPGDDPPTLSRLYKHAKTFYYKPE